MKGLVILALFGIGCGGGASPDAVCKKLMELAKKEGVEKGAEEGAMEGCVKEMQEEKKKMGDETWKKVSACVMKLDSIGDMEKCDPEKLAVADKGSDKGAVDEYKSKSKATEAQQFIKKMYDGARAYYMDTPAAGLNPVEPQFPSPSVGPTPPLGSCCKDGDKCAPDAAQWEKPTWVALMFSVDDPHYYSYEYKVAADNKSFEVMAYGDLDCDGEYSTFKLSGSVSGDAPSAAGAIEKTNPLE